MKRMRTSTSPSHSRLRRRPAAAVFGLGMLAGAIGLANPSEVSAEPISQVVVRLQLGEDDLRSGSALSFALRDRQGNVRGSHVLAGAIEGGRTVDLRFDVSGLDHREVGTLSVQHRTDCRGWFLGECNFPDRTDLAFLRVTAVLARGGDFPITTRRGNPYHKFQLEGAQTWIRIDLSSRETVACPRFSGNVTLRSEKGHFVRSIVQPWPKSSFDVSPLNDIETTAAAFEISPAPQLGNVLLRNHATFRFLDARAGHGGDRESVHLTCIAAGEPGAVRVVISRGPTHPLVLAAAGQSLVEMPRGGNPAQTFTLARWQPTDSFARRSLRQTPKLQAVHSGKFLVREFNDDVRCSNCRERLLQDSRGSRLAIQPTRPGRPGDLGSADYTIQLLNYHHGGRDSSEHLFVELVDQAFGVPLELRPRSSERNQRWLLELVAPGVYRVRNLETLRVMQVHWASLHDGEFVGHSIGSNAQNEKWRLAD